MLPVAMVCSMVARQMTVVDFFTISRMALWAAYTSPMTSGRGPSSRMEPPSTKGRSFFTAAYMMPLSIL